MSQLFTLGGQSIGSSASASVLPLNIQGWFPLELTGMTSLLSKGFSRVFSSTTVWKHQFFSAQPSLWPNLTSIHDYWKNHIFDYRDLGASQVVLVVKNPPASAGDIKDAGSISGSGRSPGGGHGNPLQYSCLENPVDSPMGRGTWLATVHIVTKGWMWLKWLSTQTRAQGSSGFRAPCPEGCNLTPQPICFID